MPEGWVGSIDNLHIPEDRAQWQTYTGMIIYHKSLKYKKGYRVDYSFIIWILSRVYFVGCTWLVYRGYESIIWENQELSRQGDMWSCVTERLKNEPRAAISGIWCHLVAVMQKHIHGVHMSVAHVYPMALLVQIQVIWQLINCSD